MDVKSGFFVDNNAIKYRELRRGGYLDRVIVPKEVFIEAYNKWIKSDIDNNIDWYAEDDADCWSDD
jgi:hypothetical protein